jgi:hypothetical protein
MGMKEGIKAGKAYIELGVDEAYKPQLNKAKQELDGWAKAVKNVSEPKTLGQRAKAFLRGENESGDKALDRLVKGGLESVLNVLGAGIATTVIHLLAADIAAAAEKATELAAAFKRGDVNAADMANSIGLSLPVLGEVFRAGNALNDLFTGEKEAVKAITEEADRMLKVQDAQLASAESLEKVLNDIAAARGKADTERENIGRDPYSAAIANLEESESERLRSRGARRKAAIKEATKDAIEAVKEQAKIAADAQKEFDDLNIYQGKAVSPDYQRRLDNAEKAAAQENKKLNELRAAASNASTETGKAFDEAEGSGKGTGAIGAANSAKIAEERRKAEEQFGQDVADGIRKGADAQEQARIDGLRAEGRLYEADIEQIRDAAAKKIAEIRKAAQEQKKAIGATSPTDHRGIIIDAVAGAQIASVVAGAGQQAARAAQAQHDRQAQSVRTLDELKAQSITDAEERDKASVNARYKYEIDQAHGNAEKIKALEAQKQQELANIDAKYQRQRADASREIQDQIDAMEIQRTQHGMAGRLAMIELERKQAIARENDPARRTGASLQDINRLYDEKRLMEMSRSAASEGFFSAAAADAANRGGFSGGDLMQQLVVAAKETAKNTAATAAAAGKGSLYGG